MDIKSYSTKITLACVMLMVCLSAYPKPAANNWDVYSFGAKGDGKTLDTKAIQSTIDACHLQGGGKVLLAGGQFLSGTITLKSNVTLYLEAGTTLLGSGSYNDYPVQPSAFPSIIGEYKTDKALIYAEGVENIAIMGDGIINGQGDKLYKPGYEGERPHIIHLRACKDIKVCGVKLFNSATWVQKYQSCQNLLIDGVSVDSRENTEIELPRFIHSPGRNTDGCNIVDCRNVRISNCNIVSGDDGIVFKSFSVNEGCDNITVTNCVLSTNASGIKIGTESAGTFRDFVINNCVIYDTRGAGVGLMTVDGASIERILVSNITMRNIKGAAIFVRLGKRNKIYRKGETPTVGKINDVLFQNIYGTGIERYGCSITGIPGTPITGISLQNIRLNFKGGDEPLYFEGSEDKLVKQRQINDVPEKENEYPRSEMFGKLPAYGLYVRHTHSIELSHVTFTLDKEDTRPALILDDVRQSYIHRFQASDPSGVPSLVHFRNVHHSTISDSENIRLESDSVK